MLELFHRLLSHLLPMRWLYHFFCDGLVEDLSLQAFLGIHFLEPSVFFFELLHSSHHRHIHTAKLGSPLVECGVTHTVLTAQLGHRCTGSRLFQDVDDLAI